ncbi:MAG: flavodoxin family protein [Treponema sp.]|jgi:multimeric flavodoxin WrbA|nr:flavodoxin family protein [Treponema sp.]
MKLLIISGTPKQDGICHSLVTAAAETAQKLGADTQVIKIAELKLKSCQMCADGWGICFSEHRCEFGDKDGFNDLQNKFRDADAFVFITPVYWGEVSEELKNFFDKLRRSQATKQWNKNDVGQSFMIGKPSILVASAGGGGGGIVTTLQQMERAITHMGGDAWPRDKSGIYDYIAVNRWNKDYKREALIAAVSSLVNNFDKEAIA